MAPVKISHIVSFSSQDPRYPVENLLSPDGHRPWLSCPQERSRQLRVELQLERAVPIGYIDIGNWGCAFLHIEVGRSSWPLDRPYLTLVPSVTLMTPADSKLDRNRCGVRMFKEADFLELAAGQKWDRLRLTCSQPFRHRGQFGLCFVRVRTLLEPELCHHAAEDAELMGSPQRSNPASLCRIPSAEARLSSQEEEQLKSSLQQLEPSAASHAWSPARLSRPARMVLSAAQSRAVRPPPRIIASHPESSTEQGQPAAQGAALEVPAAPKRARRQSGSRQRAGRAVGRSPQPLTRNPGPGRRARTQGRNASGGESSGGEMALCPICSGSFSTALLPAHASRCGEEESDPEVELLSSASSPVLCPICGLCFSSAEVEQHCSTCGE
ncbi:protein XNDC1N isoform X1 [Tympanuchus pallidicinctus]|uniref:protein XNDC1N isoform X1 n=1 Tax=Tympanuchus pallidicinctus TaxID=109042 RepID=UPI0022876CB3|nr:protein XNDC1N isoform X1 [Tympanuchus pallidicinctus]XP_052527317.1 protein XNDC1N isoform X1 [Tympanuchus pallidicinctus]XP_052527319.1 protein XNDC1N isoform X1 [Tympanuchus pallidicinctus]